MNELEWTGKYSEQPRADKIVELDSDDEEDPLKILAQVRLSVYRDRSDPIRSTVF